MTFNPLLTTVKLVRTLIPDASPDQLADFGAPNGLSACLMRINALDPSTNVPVALFVFQVAVRDPRAVTDIEKYIGHFQNVCSPADWQDLQVGAPDPVDPNLQLFRYDALALVLETTEQAEWAWNEIQADVARLVEHNRLLMSDPSATIFKQTAVI